MKVMTRLVSLVEHALRCSAVWSNPVFQQTVKTALLHSGEFILKRHTSITMSTPPSLDRLMKQATFFPGLNIRVGSLETTRRIIESQLEAARTSEIERQRLEHASLGHDFHSDDRVSDKFDLHQQVLHLLPKILRGGYLITLWAVLERTTHDIAKVAARQRKAQLSDRAFHKPFFVAATEAFSNTLGLKAFPDAVVEQRLRRLQEVRNALVHHDGRQSEFPEPYNRASTAALEKMGLYLVRDYDYAYIIPGELYLEECTKLVYNFVHQTAERVFNVLIPDDASQEAPDS